MFTPDARPCAPQEPRISIENRFNRRPVTPAAMALSGATPAPRAVKLRPLRGGRGPLSDWAVMKVMAETLDGLDIAVCAFDADDHTVLWNRSFLVLFPEHADAIHVGEPYRDNLRRFYRQRLHADALASLDRLVDEGLARHRGQFKPFEFEQRGQRLRVSSLPLPAGGRVRMWRTVAPVGPAPDVVATGFAGAEFFDQIADGVFVTEGDGVIAWANEAALQMYRAAALARVVGADFQSVYRRAWDGADDGDPARVEEGIAALALHLQFPGQAIELPLPNERWARIVERPRLRGKRIFMHFDISEARRQRATLERAERLARASEARLEAALDRMEQGVMMVNPDRVVEVCNRRAIELLGLPAELMRSRPSFTQVIEWQQAHGEFEGTPQDIRAFVEAGGILDKAHTYERQRPDGRIVEFHSVPIAGGGVLRTYTDVTERRRAEERLRHLARHDGLTSLVNREVFIERVAGALLLRRSDDRIAVHYLDLDGFKPVNDRHGHLVGDKVLACVAERLRDAVRDGDVVARLGGDEFAVLQFRVDHADVALGLATRLLAALRAPIVVSGVAEALCIDASVGIALAEGACTTDELIHRADTAMYEAKAAGRGAVRLHAGAPDSRSR